MLKRINLLFVGWVDIPLDFAIKPPIILNMKQEIYEIVKSVIESLGLTLYHIEFNGNVLRVLVEANDNPVTIDNCIDVARVLSTKLDTVNLIPYRYYLEVSSPGIERSLYKPEHYKRFKGHICRLNTKYGSFLGKIVDCDEATIKLIPVNGSNIPAGINFDEIGKCVTISYVEIKSGQIKVSDESLFAMNRRTESVSKEQ